MQADATDALQSLNAFWPPTRAQAISILFTPLLYILTRMIYFGYYHALSTYPGPKLWAISDLPRAHHMLKGDLHYRLCELHKQYGPVVRIGRRSLSYTDPDAWNDIYAKVRPQLAKDPNAGPPPPKGVYGLAFTPLDADHSRMRRNLSYGFSEKALRDQEPILNFYVNTLMEKLKTNSAKGSVDLSLFFNLITVDIVGDLTFGESFDCLQSEKLHDWVANIFKFVRQFVLIGVSQMFPPLNSIVLWMGNTFFAKEQTTHRGFVAKAVAKRLKKKTDRPDFMTYIQNNFDTPLGMSILELRETCVAITLAGSETTASSLCGTVYYLLRNPDVLEKLVKEVRSAFSTEEDINIANTNNLKFELAVIEESLRIFPPGGFPTFNSQKILSKLVNVVSVQSQRITGPKGNIIAGRYVPGNTLVSVAHTATYNSPKNFRDPEKFIPGRWMGDERYEKDCRKALQPFSLGPRNCIGIHLAYAEMRIILARLVWNFDMELCKESSNWVDGMKVFMIYQRAPLMIKLTPCR